MWAVHSMKEIYRDCEYQNSFMEQRKLRKIPTFALLTKFEAEHFGFVEANQITDILHFV